MKTLIDPFLMFFIVFGGLLIFAFRVPAKDRRVKLFLWMLTAAFGRLYFISIYPTVVLISLPLEREYFDAGTAGKKPEYIVILSGGAHRDGPGGESYPTEESIRRLVGGITFYKNSGAEKLILSGGNGAPGRSTEAYAMKRLAMSFGAKPEGIILEEHSRNTSGQAEEVRKIILESDAVIGLVTSGIHMRRSLKSFQKHFPQAVPLPSSLQSVHYRFRLQHLMPKTGNIDKVRAAMIEYAGYLWYFLTGKI